MDWLVTDIVWAADDWGLADWMLPTEQFVSWHNGCNTREEAIDFVSAMYSDRLILSCDVIAE